MPKSAMILLAALVLSAACGDDDKSEECPAPLPSIVGPSEIRPDLGMVPECKRPDTQAMLVSDTR